MHLLKPLAILSFAFLWLLSSFCQAASVSSPDERIVVSVDLTDDSQIAYSVTVDQIPVLLDSRLQLDFKDQAALAGGVEIKDETIRAINESWQRVCGKAKQIQNHANELQLLLREKVAPGRQFGVVFRAYNDGVAFRYVLPEQPSLKSFEISGESSQFCFAGDHAVWVTKYDSFITSQEKPYPQTTLSQIQVDGIYGVPTLIKVDDAVWVGLTEADLDDWAGMYLTRTDAAANTLVTQLSPHVDDSSVCVKSETPRESPWRVIMIGRQPGDLIESNLIANLSERCQIKETDWIKPGKSAWDWWWPGRYAPDVDFKLGPNNDTMKYFIDFASEMGWEYQLVDWQWYGPPFADTIGGAAHPTSDITTCEPEIDVPMLVKYAAEKNVKLWVWCHWKHVDQQMDKAFPIYEKWGVAGVKIDFMDRDDQQMVNYYQRVVKKAAEHRLMIDFHGAYKPTGLSIAYPNLMTREGVLGNEYNKWSADVTLDHCLTLPFTRMLAGPMDFTPGGFRHVSDTDFEPVGGDAPAPTVRGSRCFQLAMMVVYDSPFAVLCDTPYEYRKSPAGLDFLKVVPTSWDQTRVLHGEVGDTITIARRSGDDWYIGSMTDSTARQQTIKLDFLEPGESYQATLWEDVAGEDLAKAVKRTQTVRSQDTITANMVSGGGQVVRLKRLYLK